MAADVDTYHFRQSFHRMIKGILIGKSVHVTMPLARCRLRSVMYVVIACLRRIAGLGELDILVPVRQGGRWLGMSGAKRRTPPVVVRALRAVPLSEEIREQAVTALTVLIDQWWSAGAAGPMSTLDRIGTAALWRATSRESVTVCVGVRPVRSRLAP